MIPKAYLRYGLLSALPLLERVVCRGLAADTALHLAPHALRRTLAALALAAPATAAAAPGVPDVAAPAGGARHAPPAGGGAA